MILIHFNSNTHILKYNNKKMQEFMFEINFKKFLNLKNILNKNKRCEKNKKL